jgi:Right handed beta helix region
MTVGWRGALALLLACAAPSVAGPAASPEPKAVATFHAVGLYWSPASGAADREASVRFRPAGSEAWRAGQPLWFDARNGEYRGSLVALEPATSYEIELSLAGGPKASLSAATWSERFPIGETVTLPEHSSEPLRITRGGTQKGYVLYTHAPGKPAVIDVEDRFDHDVEVRASCVIIRGLTLKGAHKHGIFFPYAGPLSDVVIEENDISGWGEWDGHFGVSSDAGIYARGNRGLERVIVQRNRIHHPRTNTNPWCQRRDGSPDPSCRSHPYGPWAIRLTNTAGNNVIRYNDVRSDDEHFFEDCIGGQGADDAGFLVRDSDVYGNHIERCWDNPIEAEGANVNGRIWGNFIDRSYAAIAIEPNTRGPLYIWRNVIGASEKAPFASTGTHNSKFIKAGQSSTGKVYIYHNTLLQPAQPFPGVRFGIKNEVDKGSASGMVSRNNILDAWATSISDPAALRNDYDHDLYSGKIPAGAEPKGIRGAPRYDPRNRPGEYFLDPASPGLDAGVLLPNFSDGFAGAAPDMGAYDRGWGALEFGVDAYRK